MKLAMSLDGRTAGADGQSQWITGPAARDDVHRLRAESGAVLTGIGTALADDPTLTVRLDGDWRQPLRVVLDSDLRLPATAKLVDQSAASSLILTADTQTAASGPLAAAGAPIRALPRAAQGLDLPAALRMLAGDGVNDVLVEAGTSLAGAFMAAGLVDELLVYMAPTVIGDAGRGLMTLPGVTHFADRHSLAITDMRAVGPDWRITARPEE